MTQGGRELISGHTRGAFRRLATDVYEAAIREYWQDMGFVAVVDPDLRETSVRRRVFNEFATAVDWSDPGQVDRALRAFEHMLRFFHREPTFQPSIFDGVRERLAEDGLRLDERYKIRWVNPPGLECHLRDLTDASGIQIELERIRRGAPTDPAGAIGAAKQLVEATAKVVLTERGIPFDKNIKVPALVKKSQEALGLHAGQVPSGPDGVEPVRKILGGVAAIAIGLGELRNLGLGSGHGQRAAPAGLRGRHANLAVNAAITWCQLLLDTLADPEAPWCRASSVSTSAAEAGGE